MASLVETWKSTAEKTGSTAWNNQLLYVPEPWHTVHGNVPSSTRSLEHVRPFLTNHVSPSVAWILKIHTALSPTIAPQKPIHP